MHNAADEIRLFSDGRITSAADAMWHALGLETHKQNPTVQRLGCNLPDNPSVTFNAEEDPTGIASVAEIALMAPSHLKSWFALNSIDAFARTLTYVDIPTHYVWNSSNRTWDRRKQRNRVLGRLYPVDPSSREAWAMRVLLQHARGCTCAADIRTVLGDEHPTFVAAAVAAGLMDDDAEYHKCMSALLSAESLRSLFLVIITRCQPREPKDLLSSFASELTADMDGSPAQKMQKLYLFIMQNVDTSLEDLGLESPDHVVANDAASAFLESFVSHPQTSSATAVLNFEQQRVHDDVLNDIEATSGSNCYGSIFALAAAAGTGKTFVINAILSSARLRGLRVVPCATSGLAASLLGHARTGHGLFKIPLNVDEQSSCRPSAIYKCAHTHTHARARACAHTRTHAFARAQ